MSQGSIIYKFEQVTNIGFTFLPELVSSFNEEREPRLKAEQIVAASARQAQSSMEQNNF